MRTRKDFKFKKIQQENVLDFFCHISSFPLTGVLGVLEMKIQILSNPMHRKVSLLITFSSFFLSYIFLPTALSILFL